MSTSVINAEATALFYERPFVDVADALQALNAALATESDCYLTRSDLSQDHWWLLSCEQFHIMLSFSDGPASDPKIAKSATAPINSLQRFDYDQAVESHTAHIHIEVGDGRAPLPPQAREIMSEFQETRTCDPALKMKALHVATQFISQCLGFLAMHIGPSDRLFAPEELRRVAGQSVPISLMLHPIPELPQKGPTGKEGWTLRFKRNPFLEGPTLELEGLPVSVPLKTAAQLLRSFFNARYKGKLLLFHGEVLSTSNTVSIYVRHIPASDEFPEGRAVLSFWKDMGHDKALPDVKPNPKPKLAKAAPAAAPNAAVPPKQGLKDGLTLSTRPVSSHLGKEYGRPAAKPLAQQPEETASQGFGGFLRRRSGPQVDIAASELPETQSDGFSLKPLAENRIFEETEARAAELYGRHGGPKEQFETGYDPASETAHPVAANSRFSPDVRIKAAAVAALAALVFIWNPYGDFTGGIVVDNNGGTNQAPLEATTVLGALFD